MALKPEDGTELWSEGSYHEILPAITTLADGTLLAASNIGHTVYDNTGQSQGTIESDGNHSAAVGADGSVYTVGQVDTNVSNAVFGYQGSVGPGTGWYRGNANNANTRWAAP